VLEFAAWLEMSELGVLYDARSFGVMYFGADASVV
jgi:hypothetical protein